MAIIVILLIITAVVLTETIVYRKYALIGIEYRVYLSAREAYEGDEIEIIEEVVNGKFLPIPWLKSEIFTSRWLDFIGTTANEAANSRFVPSVFALRPYQKCVRKWRVKCLKRGVFHLEDTSILVCDVLGFVTRSVKIKVNEAITILPRPIDKEKPAFSYRALFGAALTRRFICEDPFMISGAREYSGSEPLNKIHWNSSARQGRLMVYNNDYTTENTVLVFMNVQRSAGGKATPLHHSDIELYIKLTAGLIDFCSFNNFRVGLASNGGNSESFLELPAGEVYSDTEILRSLAAFNESECSADVCDALNRVNSSGYTDIIIITAFMSPRLMKTAETLKRSGINVTFFTDCNNFGDYLGEYKIFPLRRG